MSDTTSLYTTAAASTARPTAAQPERLWHEGAANLFDRAQAGTYGHSYVSNRETLEQAARRMVWHDAVDGLPMPFSPGLAVTALTHVSGLPAVQRIAWNGTVTTHDDYEGPGAYSVVGVEFASGPTTFRMYDVDRGTDLVIAFMEWWTPSAA